MKHKRMYHSTRGVLTVFFALLSAVFLGFYSVLIESVRFRGAHAQAYLVTELGTTSVFAEYEPQLLDTFGLLAVDGAYRTGDYSIDRVRDKLEGYLKENASPEESQLLLHTDVWGLSLTDAQISSYTLLTDDGGDYFYQQAVAYMRQTILADVAQKAVSAYRDAQEIDQNEKDYEDKQSLDQQVENLNEAQRQRKQELITSGADSTEVTAGSEDVVNPLDTIRKLMKKDPLELICPNGVSKGKVGRKDLWSRRKSSKGTLDLEKEYGGFMDNLFFREYLMESFKCYTDKAEDDPGQDTLSYELEYILCGKKTDRKNIKGTAARLLLVREAANYVYAMSNAAMREETLTLATALTGWTGLAPVVIACQQALILAWAFGESLLDVRTLMGGGKVPLRKSETTWILSLENLHRVADLLKGDILDRGEGEDYRGYMRLLLNLQFVNTQQKRGLDLIELRMRHADGTSNFRVDHCVIAIKDKAGYSIDPLWSRVTNAFLGLASDIQTFTVEGGFAYDSG